MSQVLFNFHDLILMMTALQCLFFAALLCMTNSHHVPSTYFLAAFLLAHAFIPLNELVLWGADFKWVVRNHCPWLYFVGSFAYYLDGALLYFCVKSLLFRDFYFKYLNLLHFVPLLLFAIFMWFSFYSLPEPQRLAKIYHESFVYSPEYMIIELLCKCMRVGYALACLALIMRYKKGLKSTHSNIEKVDTNWVTILVSGFLLVMFIELVLSSFKVASFYLHYNEIKLFSDLGLTGYYSVFVLVNLLVFTGIRYFSGFEPVRQQEVNRNSINDHFVNPDMACEVDKKMRSKKLFLQAYLTLESLAKDLEVPARDLSMLINRYFEVNFYEFINRYRIEEARWLLHHEKDKSITDIYLQVGFNSKSVFNTFFKKIAGMTPSQYRHKAVL